MSKVKEDLQLMQDVSSDVLIERDRQNRKWGHQRHHHGMWLSILIEEIGEVGEALQNGMVSEKPTDASDLYCELIQVAAVACAFAEQVKEEMDK